MEKTVEERAFKAYFRRFGRDAPCPSQNPYWVTLEGRDYLVLDNVNGILAVYRVYDDGRLKFIKPKWFEQRLEKEES